jgi:protein N-terminal methyltransferase
MVGDDGAEADGNEGLAFLDRWIESMAKGRTNKSKIGMAKGRKTKNKDNKKVTKIGMKRAIDAGAGVGRVTKSILLKRYDTVRLVEADADFSSRSKVYLGRKRSERCSYVHARLEELNPKTIMEWGGPADLVWLQWALQNITDEDAVIALKSLASSLVEHTGVMIVKENRPYGNARLDRFQIETPCGTGDGRYDITRTDNHHRLLFQRAGLVVEMSEQGVETNTYALMMIE